MLPGVVRQEQPYKWDTLIKDSTESWKERRKMIQSNDDDRINSRFWGRQSLWHLQWNHWSFQSCFPKGRKQVTRQEKNFLTNPPKKGTGFGYLNVTIGAPPKYMSDAYERARELRKKEMEGSLKARKGGAYKLNLHPKAYFDGNPYKSDRALPPLKETRKAPEGLKPFKPSSPPKEIGGMKAGCFDNYPSHSNDPYVVKKPKGDTEKRIFRPSQGPKSTRTRSIINQNVERRINNLNFRQPITVSI
ncbi:hypothetical protein OS493_036155 [Desmophyllum pertusum]|uniref:Cilia-and flagella-associated protein 96 n=1 Tax=Desmophyllum pertusum TaxID=174260 RepID=A0A9W9ZID5_9CNID|nr:hypothetical protein OS493_036155 [Desmophyllum pertusum]